MKNILILLCLATSALAQTGKVPTEPPKFNVSFQGASFTVDVEGNWPTTYQWYRGTLATATSVSSVVKIPAPEGIQPYLLLDKMDTSGPYYCIATNAVGSTVSGTFRLSFTTQKDAADLQVVIRK